MKKQLTLLLALGCVSGAFAVNSNLAAMRAHRDALKAEHGDNRKAVRAGMRKYFAENAPGASRKMRRHKNKASGHKKGNIEKFLEGSGISPEMFKEKRAELKAEYGQDRKALRAAMNTFMQEHATPEFLEKHAARMTVRKQERMSGRRVPGKNRRQRQHGSMLRAANQ